MQASQAGKCSNCGSNHAMLRAVYDWRRTRVEGAWAWLGTSRPLCPACYADPRFGGRWIDERQKQTAQKPAWAADEPEEFEKPVPPLRAGPLPAAPAKSSTSDRPPSPSRPEQSARPASRGKSNRPAKPRKSPGRRRSK